MSDRDDYFIDQFMPGGDYCPVSDFSDDEEPPKLSGPLEKIHDYLQEIKTLVEGSQKGKGSALKKEQKAHIVQLCNTASALCYSKSMSAASPPSGTTLTAENITSIVRQSIKEELKNYPMLNQKPSVTRPLSYATIASTPSGKTVKTVSKGTTTLPSKPAIIVSHKKDNATHEETIRTFRAAADFKSLNFAPSRVQRLSKQKFRVEFDSEYQKTETIQRLTKEPNLTTETAKKLKPMIIIKGITKEVSNQDLKSLILQQNPTIKAAIVSEDNDLNFKFERKNRNDRLYNAVFIVTPPIFRAIIELAKVNVDYMRVHVEEFSPFLQCFKCLQFGHTKNKCSETVATCPHCAEVHALEHCPTKEDTKKAMCLNCKTHNTKFKGKDNTSHRATSTKCPRVKAMLLKVQQRIDYGSE